MCMILFRSRSEFTQSLNVLVTNPGPGLFTFLFVAFPIRTSSRWKVQTASVWTGKAALELDTLRLHRTCKS